MKRKLSMSQIFLLICVSVLMISLFLPYATATDEYEEYLERFEDTIDDDLEKYGHEMEWLLSVSMVRFVRCFHIFAIEDASWEGSDILMFVVVALMFVLLALITWRVFKKGAVGIIIFDFLLLGVFLLENWVYTQLNIYPENYNWAIAYYLYYIGIIAVIAGAVWLIVEKVKNKTTVPIADDVPTTEVADATIKIAAEGLNSVEEMKTQEDQMLNNTEVRRPASLLKFRITSWVLMGAGAVIIIVCMLMTLYGSFFKIPAIPLVDMGIAASGKNWGDVETVFEKGQDTLDNYTIRNKRFVADNTKMDALTKDQRKALDMAEELLDEGEKVLEKPTLISFKEYANMVNEIVDETEKLDIQYKIGYELQMVQRLAAIADGVILIVIGWFALSVLLSLLAAVCNNNVLAILTTVISFLPCALLSNTWLAFLLIVVYVVAIVLNSKYKQQKKAMK